MTQRKTPNRYLNKIESETSYAEICLGMFLSFGFLLVSFGLLFAAPVASRIVAVDQTKACPKKSSLGNALSNRVCVKRALNVDQSLPKEG